MGSVSMVASFIGGSASLSASPRRLVITNSVKPKTVSVNVSQCQESSSSNSNGRREIIFAAAAAAISSAAGVAMADEPKRGTPEAKKAYGPVCVANPTAKICNN